VAHTGTSHIDLSDIDSFWTKPLAERHDLFNELREQPGLPFFEEKDRLVTGGPGYYALTRFEDVAEVSRHPNLFSSAKGTLSAADMPDEFNEFYGSMINTDDPRHARLRRIVSRGFTPRRLEALTDNVALEAKRIVDDIIDVGECDAVRSISGRLPLTIVCDLMGVPASERAFVFDRTNTILGASDPDYVANDADVFAAIINASQDLATMMRDLGAVRAGNPTDDILSALINAEIDGEALTPDELVSFFILLVVAGNETTRNAITWGLHAFTENPAQKQRWIDDFDGVAPTAVEEIIRWASPVIFMRRTLAKDAELCGQPLRTGEKVLMFYWAANRDPKHFVKPGKFDVMRSPNPHMGFGGPGPHYCLGAHLARREIRVMFRELLTRIPDIHATGDPIRLKSSFINGIKTMPVAFTPGGGR